MDTGTGIAICGSVAAVTFPIMGVIIAVVKRKENLAPIPLPSICMDHSGMKAVIDALLRDCGEIKDSINKIFSILDELKSSRRGGTHA